MTGIADVAQVVFVRKRLVEVQYSVTLLDQLLARVTRFRELENPPILGTCYFKRKQSKAGVARENVSRV
jgi:hypothetical protein